jgi:hypothetical protein
MKALSNGLAVNTLPVVIDVDDIDGDSFIRYFRSEEKGLKKLLREEGAIKFKGVQIPSTEEFERIVNSISSKFLAYVDGNSPRTKLTNNVYTSTEYDQTMRITMHNELSYSAKWPGEIFFCCIQPAISGGETLIADSREILSRMNKDILSQVEKKGILYIRNLHGGIGIGPSWQATFETNDRALLEDYCKAYGIELQWRNDNHIRLLQRSKGIISHRTTGERLWFNQIDQFHPYHLGEELYSTMIVMYETHEDFPMYVKFGNGEAINEDMVKEILSATEQVTIAPPWQKNELLWLDNELVSHGRNPFTGERKVLVMMAE